MNEKQLESMTEVLQSLFVVIKTVAAHGKDHPFALEMSQRLSSFVEISQPPWKLQFIKGGVFRDLSLLDLGYEGYQRANTIGRALANLNFHEIHLKKNLDPQQWLALGGALNKAMLGRDVSFADLIDDRLEFNTIANAGFDDSEDEMDPELFAISQIALVMEELGTLQEQIEEGWSWRTALSILRRMDKSINAHISGATRAIELAPGGWTPRRQAFSAAFDVFAVLNNLKVNGSTIRVAAHVTLLLGMVAYQTREATALVNAAPQALELALKTAETLKREALPPHPFRVITTLKTFQTQSPHEWMGFMHLIHTVFQLEQERLPTDTSFALTRADLLAIAAQDMGTHYPPSWVKLLINTHGATPPGANVRLPNGKQGVVLNTQNNEVQVLIDNTITTLDNNTPLQLISAAEAVGLF